MQSFDSVQYTVSIGDEGTNCEGGFTLGHQAVGNPITDEFIISIVSALRGLDWPGGTVPYVTATKAVDHSDTWIAQSATNPPAFT
jgi:hypothetical protein